MGTLRDLYLEERRERILEQVVRAGRVSVAGLSQQFGVSKVTIRADLQFLSDHDLIVRTHGGAVPANHRLYDISLAIRRQRQVAEKSQIGEAGAGMVSNGDAIFLDSSSTALAIAQHLKTHRDLTIITNGLVITNEMLDVAGVTVVMPGGTLRRDTASLVGTDGLEMLKQFNIQKGFFGAHGINLPEGLTDVSHAEAEVKRPLVSMCRQVIAILDATKWGRVGLASFANPEEIDCAITDKHVAAEMVERVRSAGVEVILV